VKENFEFEFSIICVLQQVPSPDGSVILLRTPFFGGGKGGQQEKL
jgi:hypothetical protein